MQLDTYVTQVQDQLVAAAALGDDRVREVAASLASAAQPAVRLAVLAALAAAADEITAALLDAPGSPAVGVRLDTDEIRIGVTSSELEPAQSARTDEGDASARISLRLSEALKAEVDAAATEAGVSVNTWLVRAANAALQPASGHHHGGNRRQNNAQHVTGWING
jgi:hypothetical protein